MFFSRIPKFALAGLAAIVLVGGAAVAMTLTRTGNGSGPASVRGLDGAVDSSVGQTPVDPATLAPGPGGQASASGSTAGGAAATGPATAGGATATGSAGAGTAGAGATAGAATGPTAGGATGASGSATGAAGGAGGAGAGGGATTPSGGGSAPGSGSGSGSGGGAGSGGQGVTTTTVPATPPVPTAPSGESLYAAGQYDLVVPGTASVSKKLCLRGEVNRCRTINVPALTKVTVTLSYSGNASASVPTYAVTPCKGGLGVTVSGVTPGTNVTVVSQGVELTATLGSSERSQSASLCDA